MHMLHAFLMFSLKRSMPNFSTSDAMYIDDDTDTCATDALLPART